MDYYSLIQKYGKGKGEDTMWSALKVLSDTIEHMKESDPEKYWKLVKDTYAVMCGKHYNEEFGMWQIEQMSWKDKSGMVHHSPHWHKEDYKQAYDSVRSQLKDRNYTCWDFAVTLEMQHSDYICMLKEWFPNATEKELDNKVVQSAVSYLNDDDDQEGCKIWRRFNG